MERPLTLDVVVRQSRHIASTGVGRSTKSVWKGPRLGVPQGGRGGRRSSAFGCDGVLVSRMVRINRLCILAARPGAVADLRSDLVVPSLTLSRAVWPAVVASPATIAIEIGADGHDALVFCDGRREC